MIKGLISSTNKSIGKVGLVLAMRKLIKKCNTEVIIESNDETNRVLEKISGIVVATHPPESGILALLSAIKDRKDVFLIVTSSFYKFMPKLDKYLIPVYIGDQMSESFEGKIKSKIFGLLKKSKKYSKEKSHQKNIASINMAIEKINQGGLVIIFPNGASRAKDWFDGIGYMIHGIKNKKESFVVMSCVEGTSNWDWIRFLPLIGKFLPKFKVSFSNPLRMDTVKKHNPKVTTTDLENEYWKWLGSIHLWTKLSKNYLWLRMLFLFLINKPY